MRLHILNYDLELRSIAEANVQQAFVDILDNDVINPLVSLKVSQGVFVHVDNLIMIGPSGRKREIKRESGWRRISRDLLQIMPIMQRTQSRFYSRHTSRNITLGNVFTLQLFSTFLGQDVLNKGSKSMSQSHLVVVGKFRGHSILPSLKQVLPVSRFQLHLLKQTSELAFDDDCRWAVSHLNTLRLQRAEHLGDGYDVSDILCRDAALIAANIVS
jgi:hypothetical protein